MTDSIEGDNKFTHHPMQQIPNRDRALCDAGNKLMRPAGPFRLSDCEISGSDLLKFEKSPIFFCAFFNFLFFTFYLLNFFFSKGEREVRISIKANGNLSTTRTITKTKSISTNDE